MEYVTLNAALRIIAAARAKADEIGVPMNIAVVDSGANLVAFARMDKAWLGSVEIAQNKAYTARAFDMPTSVILPLAQPGGALFGINDATDHRIVIFGGGVPLKVNDQIVGAIGVSGGTPKQDEQVAEAGAHAFSDAKT